MSRNIDRIFVDYRNYTNFQRALWFLKQDFVWGSDLRFTVWRRLYFFVQFIFSYKEISHLLELFSRHIEFFKIINKFPCILELGYRNWLYYKSSTDERVNIIDNHFSMLLKNCDIKLIQALYSDDGIVLWQDDETNVSLRVYYSRAHRKEGLLAVELRDSEGMLYMSDVWLSEDEKGKVTGYIGSLQGHKSRQEAFSIYTKKYFGLRTKVMIINALRYVLENFNVQKLYAVSDHGACVNHKLSAKRRIQFSMNTLWDEIGGQISADSRFYELPVLPERRPLSEMPTKRRAKHRKQYEFLDSMQIAIKNNIKF